MLKSTQLKAVNKLRIDEIKLNLVTCDCTAAFMLLCSAVKFSCNVFPRLCDLSAVCVSALMTNQFLFVCVYEQYMCMCAAMHG